MSHYQIAQVYIGDICETVGPWEYSFPETSHVYCCVHCGNVFAKIVVFALERGEPVQQKFYPHNDICESCGPSPGTYLVDKVRSLRGLGKSWLPGKDLLIHELGVAIQADLREYTTSASAPSGGASAG